MLHLTFLNLSANILWGESINTFVLRKTSMETKQENHIAYLLILHNSQQYLLQLFYLLLVDLLKDMTFLL